MAELDARLSCVLYYFIIPGVVVYVVAVYVLGLNRHKLHHFVHGLTTYWMHKHLFLKVKEILFQGIHDMRKKSQADLNILEIGVGKGENFSFYPKGTNLTCLDPHPHHHGGQHHLHKNLEESGNNVKLVGFLHNFAEDMSDVEDNTFDAVVCTFVMCTVRDPAATLAEVKRVLKPGGAFFFLEHVAGQKGTLTRCFQNFVQFLWPSNKSKGNINRETWTFLDQSGFSKVEYKHYTANTWLFFFVGPCIYGTAVK